MATEAIPAVDTLRHSSNTGEVIHLYGFGSGGYGLEGFVLGTVVVPPPFIARSEVLVHLTAAKTSFDVWTTIKRRFGTTSTLKISNMRHALYSIKKSNLTITEYLSKVKTLCDNLTAVGSLVTETKQVSVILASLSVEYESIRVFVSTSPISLDLLTDMLLDCEARQLALLTDVPMQANLATQHPDNADGSKLSHSQEPKHGQRESGRGWSRRQSRGSGRSWFDESFSGVNQNPSVNNHQVHNHGHFSFPPTCSSLAHFCGSFSLTPAVSHPIPSRAPTPFTSGQLWYPDSGATNHITPEASNLMTASPYTGTSHVTMGNGESVSIANDIQTGTTLLEGHMHKGLYRFQFSKIAPIKVLPTQKLCSPLLNSAQISSSSLWHNRLGHPCNNTLARILKSCNMSFKQNSLPHICIVCQLRKAHKLPFGSSHTIYSFPFELVVIDVWGLAHVSSNGFSYYVSFLDMYSRYTWIYFLKSKSGVLQCFLHFHQLVRTQFGQSIKMLQIDWGEYRTLSKELSCLGIQHRVSCPYTSEQNGVAERKHRQIVDMDLSLLAQSAMPLKFWYYALAHAVYLNNRLPTPVLHQVSPSETLLTVQAKVLIPTVCVSGFDEAHFPFHDADFCSPSLTVSTRVLHQRSVLSVVVPDVSSSHIATRPARVSPEVPFYDQSLNNRNRSLSSSSAYLSVVAPVPTACDQSKCPTTAPLVTEPVSIIEAFQSTAWTIAAQAEYSALITNHTWDLMPLPEGCRAVGCKWIFKIKKHAKARSHDTRVDINNAFLNGDLSEEIYMVQPPGFEQQGPNGEHLVCKLRKALYGLKQELRAWFHKLKDFLVATKFEVSKADNSLFLLWSGSQLLYVLVYVDDIIIIGNDSRAIDRFVAQLNDMFSLKDLGKLS
ncbi:hypothetical protein CXB51_003070 [Gossypium anomalum]|uniref:Integrase catalytic domain-containing protein n=1 Tax=Gossypium anomalum TaxID=47600 RepID=A0A8J5ZP94_9ROSI|nr:hypothetical protein CXB51_003070 [Gossypium anomalum]